jgi:hypothetical protein
MNVEIMQWDLVLLGTYSYRYLKGRYGVISGSGAQAQNGNDARWNSAETFAPLCVFFFLLQDWAPDVT